MSTETPLMTIPASSPRRRSDTRLLEAQVDRLQMTIELLRARIALLGKDGGSAAPPEQLIELATAISPTTHRRYGAALVGEAFDVARATIFRQKRAAQLGQARKRPGPKTKQSDEELLAEMVRLLKSIDGHLGYRRVCAQLRSEGVVASKGRVLRLLARAESIALSGDASQSAASASAASPAARPSEAA